MTPPAGAAGGTVADLRRYQPAGTAPPSLTCEVAAAGHTRARCRPGDPMGQEVLTGERTQHRYQTCRDGSCERFACRVYREGYRRGRDEGEAIREARGHARGYSEGWAAGYAAGAASGSQSG